MTLSSEGRFAESFDPFSAPQALQPKERPTDCWVLRAVRACSKCHRCVSHPVPEASAGLSQLALRFLRPKGPDGSKGQRCQCLQALRGGVVEPLFVLLELVQAPVQALVHVQLRQARGWLGQRRSLLAPQGA